MKIDRDPQLSKKVINYFDQSGFKLVEQNDHSLRFRYSSGLLATWIFNPLKWNSDVVVVTTEKGIKAKFLIDTTAQIVTTEVKEAWKIFIDNFRQYIIDGIEFEKQNTEAAKRARRSLVKMIAWTFLGMTAGALIGAGINYLTGLTFMAYVGIILGANYVLRRQLILNRHIDNPINMRL